LVGGLWLRRENHEHPVPAELQEPA